MPAAVPILAGGLSIAGGFAASSMVVKGLMIAGGAMSVIGGVTGNRKLTQIGSIVSLAGGIGGLASGAFKGALGGASGTTSTGTTALAQGGGAIPDMLSAPVGSQAFMQGTGQAIGGNLTGGLASAGGGTGGLLGNAMNSVSGMVNLANSAAPALSGAASTFGAAPVQMGGGSALSGLRDNLKNVGGFIKDNKELIDIGGRMISGAADAHSAKKLQQLQAAHALALQEQKFDLALQLEEEMRRMKSASVTGLKPMDQIMTTSPQGQAVIPWNQPPGLIANQWQGAAA